MHRGQSLVVWALAEGKAEPNYSYSDDFLDYSGDNDAEKREYTFSEAMYEIVLAMLLNKYKTKVLKVYNKR